MMMIRYRQLAALAAILLLAGCAGQNAGGPAGPGPGGPNAAGRPRSKPNAPRPGPNAQAPSPPAPRTAKQASSPAVMSLLGSADTLAKAGHMEQAGATLERALELEPRNPFVYQRLAAVRLAQGQVGQAEELARKSNSVAGDNPFVKASNWRLIAEARRSDGDASGARAAGARAVNFRRAGNQHPYRP